MFEKAKMYDLIIWLNEIWGFARFSICWTLKGKKIGAKSQMIHINL